MGSKEIKGSSFTGQDLKLSINSVIFERLANEGLELSPQNRDAYKRRAQNRLVAVKRQGGSYTYCLEETVIEHLAAWLLINEAWEKQTDL